MLASVTAPRFRRAQIIGVLPYAIDQDQRVAHARHAETAQIHHRRAGGAGTVRHMHAGVARQHILHRRRRAVGNVLGGDDGDVRRQRRDFLRHPAGGDDHRVAGELGKIGGLNHAGGGQRREQRAGLKLEHETHSTTGSTLSAKRTTTAKDGTAKPERLSDRLPAIRQQSARLPAEARRPVSGLGHAGAAPSHPVGQWLSASPGRLRAGPYRCGGSAGLSTGFPFHPRAGIRRPRAPASGGLYLAGLMAASSKR